MKNLKVHISVLEAKTGKKPQLPFMDRLKSRFKEGPSKALALLQLLTLLKEKLHRKLVRRFYLFIFVS